MAARGRETQPLYLKVAHNLAKSISAKRVGALMPTEEELSVEFGVSRYTIRAAIRVLRAQGLLSARRGIGTRVEARKSQSRYSQSLRSHAELVQYAQETTLKLISAKSVTTDNALAKRLGTRASRSWIHFQGIRRARGKKPFCWTDFYVDSAFGGAAKDIGTGRMPGYALIERKYGEAVVEIRQDIQAVLLSREHAAALDGKPNTAALLVTRRYFGAGGNLIKASFNIHPADRYTYSMRVQRDGGKAE
jgi:GntR family transcriptional regulator